MLSRNNRLLLIHTQTDVGAGSYTVFSAFELTRWLMITIFDLEFEPDEPETVFTVFRLLDPSGKGYNYVEEMRRHL